MSDPMLPAVAGDTGDVIVGDPELSEAVAELVLDENGQKLPVLGSLAAVDADVSKTEIQKRADRHLVKSYEWYATILEKLPHTYTLAEITVTIEAVAIGKNNAIWLLVSDATFKGEPIASAQDIHGFVNPAPYIDDPKGEYVRIVPDGNGKEREEHFRLDPQAALEEALVHTLIMISKLGGFVKDDQGEPVVIETASAAIESP